MYMYSSFIPRLSLFAVLQVTRCEGEPGNESGGRGKAGNETKRERVGMRLGERDWE